QGSLHRPPICHLVWGALGIFFEGMLTNLTQTFTLFLPIGTPVRASLGCTFTEWVDPTIQAVRQNKMSPDVSKTRVVRRGDTLASIAAAVYNDPTLWRPIARANAIVNPLRLTPGQVLTIPVLPREERQP
ncbi:MAG: LysM peptidoglycan-binding domain-containing protein, partial [Chloroflexales bacterium]|nr:LysM peptidoglycan-binding domain-containing protein [Chloroflexales bacterium]